jgi:hypothetical protein
MLETAAAVADRAWRSRMSLTRWWMEAIEMAEHFERTSRFLALHQGEQPLLLPNPWDRGSAVQLAWLGFQPWPRPAADSRRPWAVRTGR